MQRDGTFLSREALCSIKHACTLIPRCVRPFRKWVRRSRPSAALFSRLPENREKRDRMYVFPFTRGDNEERAIDSCKKKKKGKKRKEKKKARESGFPSSTDIEREKKMFGCPPLTDDLMEFKVIAKARAIIFAFSRSARAAANRDLSMQAYREIFLWRINSRFFCSSFASKVRGKWWSELEVNIKWY